MIKDITNKKIEITFKDETIELPIQIQEEIKQHWEDVKRQTPELWNGEVTCISDYYEDDKTIRIVCKKSDYAHYIYDERKGLPKQYACSNLAAGALLETSDGYYVAGELDERTSYPFCIQVSGGNVDKQDVLGENVDIARTIKREVQEEINIDLNNNAQVKSYSLKYINTPGDKEHGYQIFAKGTLNMTLEEMKQYYERYLRYLKENSLEVEFGKLHFIPKGKCTEVIEGLPNPKRGYLKPLLEIDSKNLKKGTQDVER